MRASSRKPKPLAPTPSSPKQQDAAQLAPPTSFPVVGVGASAGGLEACSELLRNLPAKTGLALVLVQHLDPKHSSELREILSKTTAIPVVEVTDGAVVQPDRLYVIPPNASMVLRGGALRLSPRLMTRGQHLPIDHFLRSLAEDCGPRSISVILSGAASDGTEGSRAVKAAGGITFAQDARSAAYSSMPQSAARAGCVDFVVPPAAIARELARLAQHPYLVSLPGEKAQSEPDHGTDMEALLGLVFRGTGVDFTHYKLSTLERRIKRRMVLHKLEKLRDYTRFVRNTPREVDELYQDILIHVTGFFRDPETFDALRKEVFPYLCGPEQKTSTIRIWVPGCSTGEEPYSLAMSLLEYIWLHTQKTAHALPGNLPFQIFATDISDISIDRARAGIYSETSVADISPERLKRFFTQVDGGYQINKPVREMCIFAKQNVAKDPPFSHVDLISCRNLLIYLGPILQNRVIPVLHYALRPSGYLMLGEAEGLGAFAEYFMAVDKKSKIFQKRRTAGRPAVSFGNYSIPRLSEPRAIADPPAISTVEKEAERILFNRYVPASIVVNDDLEIVQFRGKTGAYLEPPAGQPSFSLIKMAREGLLVDLRAALTKAKKDRVPVRKQGIHIQSNGGTREISLEVIPLRQPGPERYYVIIFENGSKSPAPVAPTRKKLPKEKEAMLRENERLRAEQAQLRAQLQTLLEDHEAMTEEYKAANEEILSANEELQSTNEELETAKEELQSSNEELTTLNEEVQNRNAELSVVNGDLLNLLDNVSITVVIVDKDMLIRRSTPSSQKLLNLLPGDVGRRLTDIRPNLDLGNLGDLVRETIENGRVLEGEVREVQPPPAAAPGT